MPSFIKTKEDEDRWKYAKRIALKALHDKSPSSEEQDNKILTSGKSWGFVTNRYKKLKSGEIKKSIVEALSIGYIIKKINVLWP